MTTKQFPADFIWGSATSSYQIEGAVHEDGRSPSIWDTFSHTPGKVQDDDTGDVASDHYHRWTEDVRLMQDLGLNAYRFSIAWPRVLPDGTGAVNQAGLDFYSRLVDGLLEAGITPFVTLYHWDLPQVLEDAGGWVDRAIADYFVGYTEAVARCLGDRVKHWITLNEPMVFTFVGYWFGAHAPGHQDAGMALQASHHCLLAHGRAVPVIREFSPGAEVGITLNMAKVYPVTDSQRDAAAADRMAAMNYGWFADPVYGKGYPQIALDMIGDQFTLDIQPGDMETIAAPVDFLGVNNYFPNYVRARAGGRPSRRAAAAFTG
jgi:beta-glucosidase